MCPFTCVSLHVAARWRASRCRAMNRASRDRAFSTSGFALSVNATDNSAGVRHGGQEHFHSRRIARDRAGAGARIPRAGLARHGQRTQRKRSASRAGLRSPADRDLRRDRSRKLRKARPGGRRFRHPAGQCRHHRRAAPGCDSGYGNRDRRGHGHQCFRSGACGTHAAADAPGWRHACFHVLAIGLGRRQFGRVRPLSDEQGIAQHARQGHCRTAGRPARDRGARAASRLGPDRHGRAQCDAHNR